LAPNWRIAVSNNLNKKNRNVYKIGFIQKIVSLFSFEKLFIILTSIKVI